MIRNEIEYREALKRLQEGERYATNQQAELRDAGLTSEEVETVLEPAITFQAKLQEEIAWYENVRRGELPPLHALTGIGRLLIALRIARGLSQREFADRLQVSEAAVSRDERNEYHGITVERAQRVLDALDASTTTVVRMDNLTPNPVAATG
jgi:DNA-directed RNA polymerase specialized sigma subunit